MFIKKFDSFISTLDIYRNFFIKSSLREYLNAKNEIKLYLSVSFYKMVKIKLDQAFENINKMSFPGFPRNWNGLIIYQLHNWKKVISYIDKKVIKRANKMENA